MNWQRRLLWLWLGLLVVHSIAVFGGALYTDLTCFFPGQHWPWWWWRKQVILILAPWLLTGIGFLAAWLYRRFT